MLLGVQGRASRPGARPLCASRRRHTLLAGVSWVAVLQGGLGGSHGACCCKSGPEAVLGRAQALITEAKLPAHGRQASYIRARAATMLLCWSDGAASSINLAGNMSLHGMLALCAPHTYTHKAVSSLPHT